MKQASFWQSQYSAAPMAPYVGVQGFVFDPMTGHTFTMNSSARFIFDRVRKGWPRDRIADDLVSEFGVEANLARGDVDEFMARLQQLGLEGRATTWSRPSLSQA